MGKVFESISDELLEDVSDFYQECHVCNTKDVALYEYMGTLNSPDGEIEEEIDAACYDCITTKNLTHGGDYEYIRVITEYVDQTDLTAVEKELAKEKLIKKYQSTPDVVRFMQRTDFPLCCVDITEFIGYPKTFEELIELTETGTYWEGKEIEESNKYRFSKNHQPEGLSDVAAFICNNCSKKYYTFQFS